MLKLLIAIELSSVTVVPWFLQNCFFGGGLVNSWSIEFFLIFGFFLREWMNLKLIRIQRTWKFKAHACDKAIHTPNCALFVDIGLSSPKNGNYTEGPFFSFVQSKWKISQCDWALVWNDKSCTWTSFSFSNCASTLLPFHYSEGVHFKWTPYCRWFAMKRKQCIFYRPT